MHEQRLVWTSHSYIGIKWRTRSVVDCWDVEERLPNEHEVSWVICRIQYCDLSYVKMSYL